MIYIVDGPPGSGKSYYGTMVACRALEAGRRVYTNYPVVYRGKTPYVWEKRLTREAIFDAVIVIDEAYRDVSSRDFKKFSVEEHTFFATNRHNDLDIYLIAQSVNRVDVIIREMANEILRVSKTAVPMWRPLWFRVDSYVDEMSYAKKEIYYTKHYLFRWKYANAYDTKAFRRLDEPYTGITWAEKMKQQSIDITGADIPGEVIENDW